MLRIRSTLMRMLIRILFVTLISNPDPDASSKKKAQNFEKGLKYYSVHFGLKSANYADPDTDYHVHVMRIRILPFSLTWV